MDPDFKSVGRSKGPEKIKTDRQLKIKTGYDTSFLTPEEVAAADSILAPVKLDDVPAIDQPINRQTPVMAKQKRSKFRPSKKNLAIIGVFIVMAGVGGAFFMNRQATPTISSVKVNPTNTTKPTTVASNLSGLDVSPAMNDQPVTGIMVENSMQARPQAGLSQAGVVFEAIAEGGVTRFLALFQDTAPANVGPIRSARPYYAQWALGFDAGYAHVGGSPKALANIKEWGVKDLDQFQNSGAYSRISSRPAPHNVYTSVDKLKQLQASKGFTKSTYKGFPRKKDTKTATVTAKAIDFAISGPAYNVHYDYEAASNSYKRSLAGAAHVDSNGNTQISPKVVIAMIVPYGLEADGYHSSYTSIGTGPAYVFQDGIVTIGQWSKPDLKSQITFSDSSGKPLKLNPGQTWITALSAANKVTYKP